MTKNNKSIKDKSIAVKTNFFTQVWKNLREYPKSIIFYFLIFCYSLHPKCIRIVFSGADNYFIFLAPILINIIIFIFIFNIYGKKIFINIFNPFFLISFISFFIFIDMNNSLFMLAMLILYSFYYTLFIISMVLFTPSKTKKTLSGIGTLFWIISCVSIPYIYHFSLIFYHRLTNITF